MTAAASPCLQVQSLSVGYGAATVVHAASFAVPAGRCAGLVGPNGAGKTTLFRAIVGELPALSGRLALTAEGAQDVDLTPLGLAARARLGLGYAPQRPALLHGLSVRDNLRAAADSPAARAAQAWAGPPDPDPVGDALERTGLTPRADTPAANLSGGQLKRLAVARLCVLRSRLWLCDEPFAGLDADSAQALVNLLHDATRRGITLVVAEHRLDLLRLVADHLVRVEDGAVALDDAPQQPTLAS